MSSRLLGRSGAMTRLRRRSRALLRIGTDQAFPFRKLLQLLQFDTPSSSSDHQAWVQAAARWAEIGALRWSPEDLDRDCGSSSFASANFLSCSRLACCT
jgi:hypothetical protein